MAYEADLTLLTHAGPEPGVASTKAFTTQLAALLLAYHCARIKGMDIGQSRNLAKSVTVE